MSASAIKFYNEFINTFKSNKEFRNSFIKTVLITGFFVWFLYYLGTEAKESAFLTQAKLQHVVDSFGIFSWLAYVGLVFLAVMTPLPDTAMVVLGGYIFGPVVAIPLAIVGQLLGASLCFYLARKLGRSYVVKKFPNAMNKINTYSNELGWQTVFLMRLTPSLSFDFLSFASGLSTLQYKRYILATVTGMVPLIIITSMLGYGISLKSTKFITLVIVIGAMALFVIYSIFKKITKNHNRNYHK